jgi:hypothetical protein
MIDLLTKHTKLNFESGEYTNKYMDKYKIRLNNGGTVNFLSFLPTLSFSNLSLPYDMTIIQTELQQWFTLICEGQFYKFLQKETNLEHVQKSEFKNNIFFAALYGPIVNRIANNEVRAVNECLHKNFPNMMLINDYIKRRGQDCKTKYITKNGKKIRLDHADTSHAILPKLMQLMEADFMYNQVCQRIKDELHIKCLTIHDSILVQKGYGEQAKQIMEECHQQYNLKPLLKVESL